MAVGDLITAARYNNAQARVAAIMGTGSGTEGYGQTVNSSQVNTSNTVTAVHVNNLYTDLVAGRIHQTGGTPNTIAQIVVGDTIADQTSDNPDGTLKGFQDFEDLITIFEKNRITKIDTKNKKFNPNLHQAMTEIENNDVESGNIVQEIQSGYMLGERLLRPALVGIAKKKNTKSEEKAEK